jgi:hypothetical protein
MRVLQGVGGPLKERHEALISPHEELSQPTAGDNRAVVARPAGGLLSVSLDGAANHPQDHQELHSLKTGQRLRTGGFIEQPLVEDCGHRRDGQPPAINVFV